MKMYLIRSPKLGCSSVKPPSPFPHVNFQIVIALLWFVVFPSLFSSSLLLKFLLITLASCTCHSVLLSFQYFQLFWPQLSLYIHNCFFHKLTHVCTWVHTQHTHTHTTVEVKRNSEKGWGCTADEVYIVSAQSSYFVLVLKYFKNEC